MVCTVFSRFSSRTRSCASASGAVATTLVGPVASTRRISASVPPAPVMLSVLRPTDGSPRSWKPQEASRSARAAYLNHDIDELSRHDDHLLGLLPTQELDDLLIP